MQAAHFRRHLIEIAVIPVDEFHILRDAMDDILRNVSIRHMLGGIVIIVVKGGAKVHIAPHHRSKAVLLADVVDLFHVATQQLHPVNQPMLLLVATVAHHPRLVKADVHPTGGEALRQRPEHRLDEVVGFRLVDEQDVVVVRHLAECTPAGHVPQVSQHLNTGSQLHAEAVAVGRHLLHLRLGVLAP